MASCVVTDSAQQKQQGKLLIRSRFLEQEAGVDPVTSSVVSISEMRRGAPVFAKIQGVTTLRIVVNWRAMARPKRSLLLRNWYATPV